ncbi:hypothetical protein VT84_37040 [Gemmata sp. SH-PL17]|uniref:hypothetical protein n=1 Tax=Gemmata sp. SH-PL17 TaxID=1630693 RepID=UPI00078B17B0|nr:hypothetical protein [Gemmata sp. SH-PL17]AMV30059.1 hypothetical protein VT84_37040 [Gemmata sp. SH-PL17]
MARSRAGQFDLRIVVLARVLNPQARNGEERETWPDPAPGTNEYFAARDAITSGEDIAQGIRQSTGGLKLRIKGRSIAVTASDRIRKKVTGEVFAVVGVAREKGETVVTVERVTQSVPQ